VTRTSDFGRYWPKPGTDGHFCGLRTGNGIERTAFWAKEFFPSEIGAANGISHLLQENKRDSGSNVHQQIISPIQP
jgi:hypothetical protein